jgi:hypothetical protein
VVTKQVMKCLEEWGIGQTEQPLIPEHPSYSPKLMKHEICDEISGKSTTGGGDPTDQAHDGECVINNLFSHHGLEPDA